MSVTTVPIQPIKKGALTKMWLGLAVAVLVAVGLAWVGTADAVLNGATDEQFLAGHSGEDGVITTESGLQYKILKPGEGASPTATDTALVKYEGRLRDGTIFDAQEQAPMPIAAVVSGFSEAMQLMQKGGEYRIWIPSELGYGPNSPTEVVPANSLLIFDVTLLDFITAEQMQQIQQQAGPPQGPPPGRR